MHTCMHERAYIINSFTYRSMWVHEKDHFVTIKNSLNQKQFLLHEISMLL